MEKQCGQIANNNANYAHWGLESNNIVNIGIKIGGWAFNMANNIVKTTVGQIGWYIKHGFFNEIDVCVEDPPTNSSWCVLSG